MNIEKMYLWPDAARIRLSIFWGAVEEIISPNEAKMLGNCLPGVSVKGLEVDFLDGGKTKQSKTIGFLLPYETYLDNIDFIKVGTKVRNIIIRNTGGSSEPRPEEYLQFKND